MLYFGYLDPSDSLLITGLSAVLTLPSEWSCVSMKPTTAVIRSSNDDIMFHFIHQLNLLH